MALERLAFGGEEFKYDTLPGLGARFAIGNREIADHKPVIANINGTAPKRAATPVPVVALPASDTVQTEVQLQEYHKWLVQAFMHA